MQTNTIQIILNAGMMVKFVMLVLLFFSVVSWAIIILKFFQLKNAETENSSFAHTFRRAKDLETVYSASKKFLISPISNVFRAMCTEADLEYRDEVRRTLTRFETLEAQKLERHLSFLATCGSATPFIGLFGTVWGIMTSFMSIGEAGQASLAVVAPGIAEALIATAMGLMAAIPAVIAYNFYLSRTRRMIIQMEDFSEEVIGFLQRPTDES